jgi:Domain of unknown function (DUF1707)
MTADPRIRASDDDRDRTATLLREHHAAGRLTAEEFNERLDKAFAAKTLGDLDELLSDLPSIDLYHLPDAALRRRPPVPGSSSLAAAAGQASPPGRFSPAWQAAWGSWLTTSAILTVVWVLTGMSGSLWFLWIVAPWGLVTLGRWLSGDHPGGSSHGHGQSHHGPHDHGHHHPNHDLPSGPDQVGGPPE